MLSGPFLTRALIPFTGLCSYDLITSHRPWPSNTITMGLRVSTQICGGWWGEDINIPFTCLG